ncbi:MAG: DUF3418 domain-containing protein, partial [Planctomycetota bacterium]
NVAVVDESGKVLQQGRDVIELQNELGAEAGDAAAELSDPAWQRDGLNAWPDVDELPTQVEINPAGYTLLAYPALIDQGSDGVGLRTVETPERAAAMHRDGVLRLAALTQQAGLSDELRYTPQAEQLRLLYSPMGAYENLTSQLIEQTVGAVYGERVKDYPPRSSAAFDAMLVAGRDELSATLAQLVSLTLSILQQAQQVRLELDPLIQRCPPGWEPAVRQSEEQLRALVGPDFMKQTPREWLPHLPRFLKATQTRLRKLREGKVDRDQAAAAEFASRWDALRQFVVEAKPGDELGTYRWMLEEWRVSLFAQELGTSIPVSDKRLDKQWKKAQRNRG